MNKFHLISNDQIKRLEEIGCEFKEARTVADGDAPALIVLTKFDSDKRGNVSDLIIIDELLCLFMENCKTSPEFMEQHKTTREAMQRLRSAWKTGEIDKTILTWSSYFERVPEQPPFIGFRHNVPPGG